MTRKRIANMASALGAAAFLALAGIGVGVNLCEGNDAVDVTDCHREALGSVVNAIAHEGFNMATAETNRDCIVEE